MLFKTELLLQPAEVLLFIQEMHIQLLSRFCSFTGAAYSVSWSALGTADVPFISWSLYRSCISASLGSDHDTESTHSADEVVILIKNLNFQPGWLLTQI
jgi:hypothetical protein